MRLVGVTQSDYSVCLSSSLCMLEVQFMRLDTRDCKDVELDKSIQLLLHSVQCSSQTVDRSLKLERFVVSSPEPHQMSDNFATWAGHGMQVPRGQADTWQEDTCSEGGSLRGSSEKQIYFYMPSRQTQNRTSG